MSHKHDSIYRVRIKIKNIQNNLKKKETTNNNFVSFFKTVEHCQPIIIMHPFLNIIHIISNIFLMRKFAHNTIQPLHKPTHR